MAPRGSHLCPDHVVHLRSERLVLRRFTADDDELLVDLDADPEVTRYLRPHVATTLERMRGEIMPRVLGYYERGTDIGAWAAHENNGGAFVGWVMLRPDHAPPHDPELGYRLRRDAWGKGYGTELGRLVVGHGFDRLGYARIMARAETENIGSWRIMEKLGMTRERQVLEEGIPVFEYGIDRATWQAQGAISAIGA